MAWIQFCLIAFLLPWIYMQINDDYDYFDFVEFLCLEDGDYYCNISRKCIKQNYICDGFSHCEKHEDESPTVCSMDECRQGDHYYCNISGICINTTRVCDGIFDCEDHEDESPPLCSMDNCTRRGNYFCSSSRKCIPNNWVCDGHDDCGNNDDESLDTCTRDECFRRDRSLCFDDRCVPTNWLCDGKDDCFGALDEYAFSCSLRHRCESNRSILDGCLGRCKPGYFGTYCGKKCSENCLNGICHKSSGFCNNCASGYTGEDCQKKCLNECLNGTCHKSSGICKDCTRTYLENCSQECGEECQERNGFPQCDRQSGKCLNGCKLYHYGHYCNNTCKNCKGNSSNVPCDINGVCHFGCENDYWDKYCNSKCSASCKGDEHGQRCNSSTGECINGCTHGWSGNLCLDSSILKTKTTESNDRENVSFLNTTIIAILVIVIVVVVVVGIIFYFWSRKRFNRQQNERIEPRREFRTWVAPRQQPSRSRRRQSSTLYAEINEETMEHYHYICEQNHPDHYDKIKDRKPCICPYCVRERVDPILARISSGSSSTTFVEPYATGGGSFKRRSSIHSYMSKSELNPRRSVTTNDSDSGILSTKVLTDDRKPRRIVSHSDSDLSHVCKTDNTIGVNPRPCVAKSKSCIELVCTHEYLDLEELYQTAKAEDRRKLAAKYFDEGEDVFGVIGQFQANDIPATEREECEVLNLLDHPNRGQNRESSLVVGQSEQTEESCCANDKESIAQPAQSQNVAIMDDPKDTDRQQ